MAPEAAVISLVRINPVTSSPLSSTRPDGISSLMPLINVARAFSLFKSSLARSPAKVTALYMAPVSRNSKSSRRARALAAVLLPAPAGPSIVTIISLAACGLANRNGVGFSRLQHRAVAAAPAIGARNHLVGEGTGWLVLQRGDGEGGDLVVFAVDDKQHVVPVHVGQLNPAGADRWGIGDA